MTGKLCSNIGAWDNTAPLPSDVPTFAHHLTTDICPSDFNPDGRPFFMVASFTHPHDPYVTPRRFWDLYRDENIDMARVPFHASRRAQGAPRLLRLDDTVVRITRPRSGTCFVLEKFPRRAHGAHSVRLYCGRVPFL
jgi:arylsulfatase A-like enzyme